MDEILIDASLLSKKYSGTLKDSMLYGIQDITRIMLGKSSHGDVLRKNEFWSLDNVSFKVKRGECIGLIGPNGAGKSTLLKILNGIIMPDKGRVELRGRVGALIELGAGFHPLLTGKENIYVNGAILGMSKREIDSKIEKILEMADIGNFINAPIKYYSSGMLVRLGFSIAAQMEPDILLIDEILAVGDASFRAKCYDAIYSLMNKCAIIFVTHDMTHVNRMCSRVIVLDKGKQVISHSPAYAIRTYFDLLETRKMSGRIKHTNGQADIDNLKVTGFNGTENIYPESPFELSFQICLSSEIEEFTVILSILSRDRFPIAYSKKTLKKSIDNKKQIIRFISPQLTLSPDRYSVAIAVYDASKLNQILWYYDVSPFTVVGNSDHIVPVSLIGTWSTSDS